MGLSYASLFFHLLGTPTNLTSLTRTNILNPMRDTYSVYEAKAKLSQIIRSVKNRCPVTITERGTPVARVVPVEMHNGKSLESRLKELESRGILLPAEKDPAALKTIKYIKGAVKRFLTEDRD